MKTVLGVYTAPQAHWVGDGFQVRSLFSYHTLGRHLSPFLLLDYAAPNQFAPTNRQRGVGQHPHRGFETVTIVYDGELEHRDSTGAGGLIGPGDVQWMTAGAGIMHEERHSAAFAQRGGNMEMVQLWVNLPREHKMTAPGYQTLLSTEIPTVTLDNQAGVMRVIAGQYGSATGAARTFTDIDVWDLHLVAEKQTTLPLKVGRTAALIVLKGVVLVGENAIARAGQWVLLGADSADVVVEANADSTILVLSGEPIDEPVVGYGPFVMNTEEEIRVAMDDLRSGRFGQFEAIES